jgi:hypothetical protein
VAPLKDKETRRAEFVDPCDTGISLTGSSKILPQTLKYLEYTDLAAITCPTDLNGPAASITKAKTQPTPRRPKPDREETRERRGMTPSFHRSRPFGPKRTIQASSSESVHP